MKRLLSVLFACLLAGASAWATPQRASLIPAKATHPRAQRHHAHKAAKHRQPKHAHRGA
jgi:hypothetical protein